MSEAAEKQEPAQPPAEGKNYYRVYPEWLNAIVYFFCRVMVYIVAKLMFRVEVRGFGNVPPTGAVMIVANHGSHLDPPLCSLVSRRRLSYLAKSDLFEKRSLGYFISFLGAFPIRRGEGDRGAIKTCINILKQGKVLLIFPEGTRSPDGTIQQAKTGVAMILSQLPDTVIVPVRIDGSFEAWGKNGGKITRKKIILTVGQAFRVADLGLQSSAKKQLYHDMGREIMSKIMSASA
ncbi:MAG TPA: lysophospholipid acyltransferase family protein [Candidatus Sumerlaeota bacterium]|nr:lysophospholipid acyltransferase family protein [Candidatus Sumerlaeota bacterium]HNM46232.1 lysophospholipid acyltransferase family protein [Candidatus Sumerlaeota bacterium]